MYSFQTRILAAILAFASTFGTTFAATRFERAMFSSSSSVASLQDLELITFSFDTPEYADKQSQVQAFWSDLKEEVLDRQAAGKLGVYSMADIVAAMKRLKYSTDNTFMYWRVYEQTGSLVYSGLADQNLHDTANAYRDLINVLAVSGVQ